MTPLALTLTFSAIWLPILLTVGLLIWAFRPVHGDTFGIGGMMNAAVALILILIAWVVCLALT